MKLTPIAVTYLQHACDGMSAADIAQQYGRAKVALSKCVLESARRAALMGFWKFHIASIAEIPEHREALLRNLADAGYLTGTENN